MVFLQLSKCVPNHLTCALINYSFTGEVKIPFLGIFIACPFINCFLLPLWYTILPLHMYRHYLSSEVEYNKGAQPSAQQLMKRTQKYVPM